MVKREEALARGYSEERDHRYLSVEALEKFLLGGTHRAFVELVKKYPEELAFCFRGNSGNGDGDEVTIYYNNHAAFSIDRNGNLKEFDFNHARYLEKWQDQMQLLEAVGYVFKRQRPVEVIDKKGGKLYTIGKVSMPAERVLELVNTSDGLETLYEGSIKPIIVSYFEAKEKKEYDRFRYAVTVPKEKRVARQNLIEKIVQQKLFRACKKLKNGYYFYDLEFSQPHAKALECENQPDMLAVRFDGTGKPKSLVFVEVKSQKKSLRGKSGVKPHVWGMERYPNWLLPIRGRDACKILNQYMKIGLLVGHSNEFVEADFVRLSKEVLLVFTGQDTIDALSRGREPIAPFLLDMGYEPVTEEFPKISLDGEHPEPMEVYRKDFGQ